MKLKITLMGLMIGTVIVSQAGCEKFVDTNGIASDIKYSQNSVVNEQTSQKAIETNYQSDGSESKENTMEDFNALVSRTDVNPSEVLAFLQSNLENVSDTDATKMVLKLEELQVKNKTILEEKYSPDTVQMSFQKAYQNGIDLSKMDAITDDTLRNLLEETKAGGYKLDTAEGFYYPVIDYSVYQQFKSYVTADIADYIDIMTVESDQAFAKDAALVISWKDVIVRAIASEKFIKNYPESVKADAVKVLYQRYESIMLYGLNNTPLFDYETKTMSKEAKAAFEESLAVNTDSKLLKELKGFMDVVEKNNYKLTDEVEQYRKGISKGL